MTPDELYDRYTKAKNGQIIEYYVGDLQYDRGGSIEIDRLGDEAAMLAGRGGFLLQRRYGENLFGYLLIKSPRSRVVHFERWVSRGARSRIVARGVTPAT